MSLNLEPRTGDFTPYLKFNGKAGRWYTKNDIGEEIEVTELRAIFDFATIKTGWIYFAENEPPQTVWDTNGMTAPKPPNLPKSKRGFSVNVFAPKLGGLREFTGTSNGVVIAIRDLYNDQYEHAPERLQGKVPVVECAKVLPVKSKFGTNFEPVLKIVKWVDRPAGLAVEAPAAVPPKPVPSRPAPDDFADAPDSDLDDDLDDDIPF